MLERVHFKNIKSLADLPLPLTPMTVLVGPNGCGKSTVLDQVDLLCAMSWPAKVGNILMGRIGELFREVQPERQRSHGGEGPMLWEGRAVGRNVLKIEISPPDGSPTYKRQSAVLTLRDGAARVAEPDLVPDADPNRAYEAALGAEFSWPAIRLDLRRELIAAPSELREPPVILDPTGYGLPTLLAEIALEDHDAYMAIQVDLARVVPNFRRLHLPRVKMKSGVGYALQLELEGAGRIDADQASEGTLFALALLAAVHGRAMPPLVLIDDLDHGLHLSAQVEVIAAMRRLMAARPGLQILCTTHSPDILNCFDAAEVRVLALDAQGHTRARSLSEHPDYARFKGALHTGEFWASVGEAWVTEGRADGG